MHCGRSWSTWRDSTWPHHWTPFSLLPSEDSSEGGRTTPEGGEGTLTVQRLRELRMIPPLSPLFCCCCWWSVNIAFHFSFFFLLFFSRTYTHANIFFYHFAMASGCHPSPVLDLSTVCVRAPFSNLLATKQTGLGNGGLLWDYHAKDGKYSIFLCVCILSIVQFPVSF